MRISEQKKNRRNIERHGKGSCNQIQCSAVTKSSAVRERLGSVFNTATASIQSLRDHHCQGHATSRLMNGSQNRWFEVCSLFLQGDAHQLFLKFIYNFSSASTTTINNQDTFSHCHIQLTATFSQVVNSKKAGWHHAREQASGRHMSKSR